MSDQTPAPASPGFAPDGTPLINQQGNVNEPTGTAVDGVPAAGEDMTDEQIQQALRLAMRDDAGSFQPTPPAPPANDGTWAGEQQGQQQGQGDGAPQGQSGPLPLQPDGQGGTGAEGQPIPGTGTPHPTPGDAGSALPPGHMLVPITEYNPFTGQNQIRYVPAPAEDIGNVLGWVNGIAPEDRQAISEWLAAKAAGSNTPLQTAASGSGPFPPGPAPVAPGGVGQPQPPIQIDYSQLDPDLAAALQAQQQGIAQTQAQMAAMADRQAQFENTQAQFYAAQAAQDRSRMQSDILSTTAEFVTDHAFTPEQGEALSQAAANLQILPTMHAKHNGDIKAAVRETLETAMWTTPEFRSLAIQSELADSLNTNSATEERKRKAAAINGAGANVPRVAPPSRPLTKQEREQAMVAEIGAAMNGSQQN